jgi:hypothetical protein
MADKVRTFLVWGDVILLVRVWCVDFCTDNIYAEEN